MPSTESTADIGRVLLPIARAAIARELGHAHEADDSTPWLHERGASFVTLTQGERLRGCIGSLQAHRPLLADVRANAVAAAFQDPRFAPLARQELDITRVEISLLSPMQPMAFRDEADVLAQLRPGIDGVVLIFGTRRGTFLPQVWEQLPEPTEFMAQLKRKAGLPADFWHAELRLQRYTVDKYKESERQFASTA